MRIRPQELALLRLETQLAEEARHKQQEVFGDDAIEAHKGEPLYDEVDAYLTELVKEFPETTNGSRFINSYYVLRPQLVVSLTGLHALFQQESPGSLFLDEVGKYIDVRELKDEVLGSITKGKTRLKLTNIRQFQQKTAVETAPKEGSYAIINKDITLGLSPNTKRMQFLADIKFGEIFRQKDAVIEVERVGTTTECIINLPEERVKIARDGTVTLKNGAHFSLQQIIGQNPVRWINHEYRDVVPFQIKPRFR